MLLFLVFLLVGGVSNDPISDCQAIHHTTVESGQYANSHCRLLCTVHGTVWTHDLAEGLVCPADASGHCSSGKCLTNQELGFIDVMITTAEVPHKSNAFVEVCIKNGTEDQTLPLHNRTTCSFCKTDVIADSAHPVWNQICSNASLYKWIDSSTITLQLWDQLSSSMSNFLGGNQFNVKDMIKNGDNHKELRLQLSHGSATDAYLFTRVTWTKS